jgi:hypothetical protein
MANNIEEIHVKKDLPINAPQSPQERLEAFLAKSKVKAVTSFEDLLGPDYGQTSEEITAEVDDFLRLLEEWRSDTSTRELDLD